MPVIECSSKSVTSNYTPPPIGNGDISLEIDMEGGQRQKPYHNNEWPVIWRAGRRYYNLEWKPMIPFGYVEPGLASTPERWTQRLDTETASISSECLYHNGAKIVTESFVHLELPIIAFRKSTDANYTFKYILAGPGASRELPERMRIMAFETSHGVDIFYEVEKLGEQKGVILFYCDRPAKVSVQGNEFSITMERGTASFFLAFVDGMSGGDIQDSADKLKGLIRDEGFDGLFASHKKAWDKYWNESYVSLPGRKENDVYAVAQYHLRISSTRWSIMAGGINGWHWRGTYFAFDEYFPFMGLVTSGHMDTARKIPEFRHRILHKACLRAFEHWGHENEINYGARFHWMTDENGDECTPPGYWLEHIFHMAHVALCSWYYYQYTGDIAFLRETGYPVIARCAEFYRTQALYTLECGSIIVGKCTDLERLGPGRENAFMTTCGVIATLELAAQSAEILQVDGENIPVWKKMAEKLRESLPKDSCRYLPYPGCTMKSISIFSGTYPYSVLKADDPLQTAAMDDFIESEKNYGNMYPVGNSVCVWYAGWKGIVFARLGKLKDAHACVKQACDETNNFSEIFEISTPPMCPWFTTGEGVVIQMVNECMLQSSEGKIRIISYPAQDYAFKLAAVGGVMVEAEFSGGNAKKLSITVKQPYEGTLYLPDGRKFEIKQNANTSVALI